MSATEKLGAQSQSGQNVRFLFMDERYPDRNLPLDLQAITLTGMLIDAWDHRALRDGFYHLVAEALGDPPNTITAMPFIHASELFPDKDDDTRFRFFEGIVGIASDVPVKLIRIGYAKRSIDEVLERDPMPILFSSLIFCIEGLLKDGIIWPVMETDRSNSQDKAFAGMIQNIDYFSSRMGPGMASVDNANLGEVLYSTKKSASGAVVDCIAYLLHALYLKEAGLRLSPFKYRLAEIAEGLVSSVVFNEIISLQRRVPPPDYVSDGPIRYVFPVKFGAGK